MAVDLGGAGRGATDDDRTAHARPGTRGLGAGPRLHGDDRVLRAGRRRRVDRHDPPRARPRRHLPRHRRHVRPVHQRGAGRPGDPRAGATRSCSPPSSATCATPTAPALGVNGRPEYVRACCDGSPEAARRRPHRPLLPAPRRPRPSRSRRPSARWPSWSRRARCATSASPRRARRRSAARTPSTRSPRCRPSTRSGPATPRTEILPTVPRARHRLRRLQPARPRLPHRPLPRSEDLPADDYRRNHPRFEGENFAKNLRLVRADRGDRRRRRAARPAQLALAWVLAQGDDIVPIPGTKRPATSRRTPRPPRCHALAGGPPPPRRGMPRRAPPPARATRRRR